MSGNEEDKGDINKVYPLDLVSKLNVKPVTEIPKGTPLLMTGQPLRRVLTQAVAVSGGSGSSPTAINIVPQTMIKQGILNPSQPLTVARPTQITLATSVVQSQPSGATYHVPRGAATVANLATPRSAVATQIRAPGGIVATPQQSIGGSVGGSGFVSTVRQVTPSSSRTPSPATTWLATTGNVNVNMNMNMNMHLPNQQIVKNVASTAAQLQRISTVVGRTQIITRTTQSAASVASVTPLSTVGQLRQPQNVGVLHSTIQQQIFKTTLAQVLPTKSQTLVYSTGTGNANATATSTIATNQSHHHFMARTQGITRQTTTATTTTTATATATTTTTSGGTRSINQMIGARVAVPVTSATRLTVTPGPTTIYTTGARLSAAAGPSASSARLNLQQQQSVRPISNVATAGTLLTTTQARITTPQQPSAVVIGTQAGGRLAASVVSLHPVVVNNPLSSASSASSCTSTSTSTCTSSKQQQSKIITQGNQGQAIQLAQVPTVTKLPVVPVSSTMSNQQSGTRTINAAIVSQRPPAQTISIPITKVFPAAATSAATTPIIRRTATSSPVTSNPNENEVTYYYQDAGANMSGQSFQFSPVMVVEQTKASNSNQSLAMNNPNQMEHITVNPLPSIGKVTSSPRPSILRKRDRDDGSTLKAAKNLAPLLSNIGGVPVTVAVVAGPSSPPSRPLSRDRDNNGGNSSGGSTTISATSSPGLAEIGGDDSQPLPPVVVVQPPAPSQVALKLTEEVNRRHHIQEMSPRKKPRKQQLIGNDEPKFNIEDMQFLSENKMKKETEHNIHMHIHTTTAATTTTAVTTTTAMTSTSSALNINSKTLNNNNNNNELTVKKPQTASLLNSYRQTWKSTHNHYLRYTDVKPKDERRPTIIDLANQTQVMQKINGWKIHHLSTQMEDLCDLETQVYDKLSTMLKLIETKESRGYDKDFNRINELIKGNMQRSKIINDSTSEAKSQVMKIFEHKEHVADIIQRCASKRNFKKREK